MLSNDVYVDDLVTGADTQEEAMHIYMQRSQMFSSDGRHEFEKMEILTCK